MATTIGIFTLFEGEENEQVSITWSLTDTNTLTIFNEGETGVVTLVSFEQEVEVSTSNWRWTEGDYNLPGGNNISFNSEQGFKARPSPVENGIQTNSYLIFQFDETPDVGRIGLHVQSIGEQGNSASYVSTTGANVVPEPSMSVILGLVGLGLVFRRRK